ncbi:PDDEXK nuclease domain-containing protein [uncultured Catenibacterium sp.]|uniref:PDDEXK nuclease domain-containing protein n=1 Tax=uncultured Catenibacterium sp. TaxID=286142 RepID=UPI0025E6C852|nr:PDDEXK nuclease domain-containing protein [uncultured Catenibacterium sp.]
MGIYLIVCPLVFLASFVDAIAGGGGLISLLYNMKMFYTKYPIFQSVTGKLSWTHYCELLYISDDDKRSFYEKEAINSNWSVRELKRQISSSLFERLLLSNGEANKKKVLELALKGNEIAKPEDIVKDPYVFEFFGLPENKPMMESDLEEALVRQIEKFLLELGKGFMFVGTQQRVTFGNTHYYVDMVFYNKILRSYVLIELKTIKLMPEAVGQLNMYLNYYAAEVNDENDNPPIGLILCTDKGNVDMQYALGGLSNNIFASKYVTYMPDKEQLIAQVESVLASSDNKTD